MAQATATPPPIQTEPLNGLPSWPIGLLAGVEGSGKTGETIIASASELVGRTFMVVVGEDTPHDYACIPGQRVEVVKHDGTYRGILNAIEAAAAQPRVHPDTPNLIVLDSATRLWNLLSDNAQETANERARKKQKYVGEDGADIGRDLWNLATTRWNHVLDALREHDGPSLITARLDLQSGTDDNGQPTKEKDWKVVAQKMLPYECGFIVQMRASYPVRDNYLAKVKQWGFEHKTRKGKPVFEPLPDDFSVEWLWRKLGLDRLVGKREHSAPVVQSESEATIRRDELLAEVQEAAASAKVTLNQIATHWAQHHNGQHIGVTTDLAGLAALRDDLRARATPPPAAEPAHTEEPRALETEPARADAEPTPEPTPVRAQPARAPEPPAEPRTETRAEKQIRLAMEELAYQAEVLGVPAHEHVTPVLTDPKDPGSVHKVKVVRHLLAQRPTVIGALREQGRATEAEAYARLGDAFPILMEAITDAEGFTREPAQETMTG